MKHQALTNAATNLATTPFAPGFDAVCHNNSGGALTLSGSDDGVTYTDVVALNNGDFANVTLQPYMKVKTAGTLHLLA